MIEQNNNNYQNDQSNNTTSHIGGILGAIGCVGGIMGIMYSNSTLIGGGFWGTVANGTANLVNSIGSAITANGVISAIGLGAASSTVVGAIVLGALSIIACVVSSIILSKIVGGIAKSISNNNTTQVGQTQSHSQELSNENEINNSKVEDPEFASLMSKTHSKPKTQNENVDLDKNEDVINNDEIQEIKDISNSDTSISQFNSKPESQNETINQDKNEEIDDKPKENSNAVDLSALLSQFNSKPVSDDEAQEVEDTPDISTSTSQFNSKPESQNEIINQDTSTQFPEISMQNISSINNDNDVDNLKPQNMQNKKQKDNPILA